MSESYEGALQVAVAAAQAAGELLRNEFHRPGGPRGEGQRAAVDIEADRLIRQRLLEAFPRWGYRGEEAGSQHWQRGEDAPHLWLVDPNDGTNAFLSGWRGSSISIALLRGGRPVLGVVYAYAAPDSAGDLAAWAEGCGPLQRNGQAVQRAAWPSSIGSHDVVFLSHVADRAAGANAECVQPGRYQPVPGIAYRLALAAVGEGCAAVSLNRPVGWDYAGGHALLLGMRGDLVDELGRPIRYTPEGLSGTEWCFGGAPQVTGEIPRRPWRKVLQWREWQALEGALHQAPVHLEPGRAVRDVERLRRAQGALLGQLTGDALGSLVEFAPPEKIASAYPGGVRELADGGTWGTLAGQPTDDSELALTLARTLVREGSYEASAVAEAYGAWFHSAPFDCGGTIRQALSAIPSQPKPGQAAAACAAAASATSQANGSLMRASPLGIWGAGLPADALAKVARLDSTLTHPHLVCQEACAAYVVAIARAIRSGGSPEEVYDDTLDWAASSCRAEEVKAALREAAYAPPKDRLRLPGWVLVAFQNAFYQLLHAPSLEEGVVRTVMAGGDTDTNAAVAGALLGAVHGREAIPAQWRRMVLTCRPIAGFSYVQRPRPPAFWPVDAMELAERLIEAGSQ